MKYGVLIAVGVLLFILMIISCVVEKKTRYPISRKEKFVHGITKGIKVITMIIFSPLIMGFILDLTILTCFGLLICPKLVDKLEKPVKKLIGFFKFK